MTKKVIKKKNKKNKNKKILKIALIIILLILVLVIVKKQENEALEKTILIISNEDVTDNLKNEIIIKEDIIYISFEDMKQYFDENIYQEESLIITTSDKKVSKLEINKDKIIINGSSISIQGQPFIEDKDIIYLPISEMENVYDINLSLNKSSKIITIDYYSKELIKAYAKKNITIKSEKSKFSKTIEKVKKGNWLIYILEEDGWGKVRTQNGKIGYVKYKNLTNFVTERENMKLTSDIKTDRAYLERDITKENISTYKKREKLINTILKDTVNKDYSRVKIIYKKDSNRGFERFKLEVSPILKECGIDVVFN